VKLKVACTLFRGGDSVPPHSRDTFTPEWADRLYRGLARNLTVPWEFWCLTDEPAGAFNEDVHVEPFAHGRRDLQSCILECFRLDGRVLFMGLDTIITGNMDDLARYDGPFAMIRDPNFPTRAASGVMSWRDRQDIWAAFLADDASHESHMFGYPADQGWLERFNQEWLCERFPRQLVSYKCHVKRDRTVLDDARLVYFHGMEKPHQISEPFVRECWW